ncbi:hypothetical protein [Providencia stuartii]|uniref:hypothetical protein n=1 Tax=Providencia stuartii TaxID=588 RepID=UPI0011228D6F|nr:hypothetical protein [Providencia stuartii]
MTVSTEISSNEYTGNGVTTDFDYKFRIFKANQLSVITSDADGDNVVTLRLGTDYTVTGANKSAGGKIILTRPLANGHKISIARDIPITQETSFRNQSKFFAETHEDAFDYLTMILQRIWGSLGSLYLKRPNILANWFDAKGYRIANLGKPKRDSDAVDLGTLKDEISGVNSTILKREKRLFRVDDMDIEVLPKANERAGNVLTFDKNGRPIVVAPASGSAVDVLNQLANGDGDLIGIGNNRTLKDKLLESVSVTDFIGCNSNYHPTNNPQHSNSAFKEALDFEWVTYPAADSLARYPKPKSTKVRIPCGSYLITETLPITSGLHLDFDDGVVLYFKPSSNIDLFSPPINEMKAAYDGGHKFWNDMSLYGVQITGAAVIQGNMTATSNVHARHCIFGGNFHRSKISRLTIEGFETGIYVGRLDTSEWTGSRIGNFYNNIIDNVYIRDCKNNFINTSNLTTLINSQIGNEVLRKTDVNTGDYLVYNTGAGFTAINSNIASVMRACNTKLGHIYDRCLGSTYTGCYSEYFDNLFVLNPDSRFGGISIDPAHLVKYPTDIVIKFSEGYMPGFDLDTRQRTGRNLKGSAGWAELPTMGFRFGNSNANLITDFFELTPMYDFKYGMYGVYHSAASKVAVDTKRFEAERTGFLSNYGARFIAGNNTTLFFPVDNLEYETNVCVLYRVVSGSWPASNIKLNAGGTNEFITVGEDMYDYGNGWKMAVVRNVRSSPIISDYKSLQIDISVGVQLEIEHIGAYKNGVPLFPSSANYKPIVNSNLSSFRFDNPNRRLYSGGTFALGDLLLPYVPLVNGSIASPSAAPVQSAYVSQEGTRKNVALDGSQQSWYQPITVQSSAGLVNTSTPSEFQHSIGVGDYIGVTSGSITYDDIKVIRREYDKALKKYSGVLQLSKTDLNGQITLDHSKNRRAEFTKI